jgi:hypothetical protein
LNLEQWCKIDESISIAENDEQYKHYAGFDYNEKLMEHLAELRLSNSKIFIEHMANPTPLLLGAIEETAYSKTKSLEIELHNARTKIIVSSKYTFDGTPVNWNTWRQFNSKEKSDASRKEVFDEFVSKTHNISPLIESRFSSIKETYKEYEFAIKEHSTNTRQRLDPLSGYLKNENVTYDELVEFVKLLGQRARNPFREALNEVSKIVLNKEAEYYDDFYFFRNKIYEDIESRLAVDPLFEVKKILRAMEFDLSNIHFDIEDRKNKYPSPICFFVQIPHDIRVLYKSESPYFDLQGCFHESGHAMHASSVDENNPYWDKYRIPMGIAEIFSILLERITKNRTYLQSLLGRENEAIINKICAKNKFLELFFVTFYAANSLMKLEYWNKNLTVDEACQVYARLIKEYTGFDIPGQYWLLHHILPESIMYVPSYLLAAVRAAELDSHMKNRFGDAWWYNRESGKRLREIMNPGAQIDLSIFSKLDSETFLMEILN